ncbi:MAG: proteasome subunit alpha [Candidatus Heimdallarchaeota archaeon]|nr:proteasome subunit alpha [Candidatus Heimdallarchaeota archaeon]MDH5644647.1 proteasome subunit alpha [Candidatus Heimdallarchaeota archaeon]
MFGPSASQGYDRSTVMYSPDGRIIQTEYAREAMRRGSIAIGLRSEFGVVLAGRLTPMDLDFPNRKISKINDRVSSIFSGYAADGRVLINRARVESVVHDLTYEEPIDIQSLVTKLADYTHMYTQQAGLRPLGIGLLVAGIDEHDNIPHLFFILPGGALIESRAKAIGDGEPKAMKFLKDKHKEQSIDTLKIPELEKLAMETLNFVSDGELPDDEIEIWSMGI